MILKSYEINKIDIKKNKILLFYGQNSGAKEEAILDILKNNEDYKVIKYEEKEFLDNSNAMYEDLLSRSLFDNKRILIIKRISEKIISFINYLEEKNLDDLLLIIEANNLEKKSKLRLLFEKSKNHICVPFYPDNPENLSKIVLNFFRKKNIKISQSNLNLLINKCKGDRGVLKNELIKIELFMKNKEILKLEDLIKLTNLIENHSISELVDNCLARNVNKTLLILNENILGIEDCVIITRTFLQKIKRLLNLMKDFKENKNLDTTLSKAKPPIFWKDKDIVKQQIIRWKANDILKLLSNINEIELQIKQNKVNPISVIKNFIMETVSIPFNNKI